MRERRGITLIALVITVIILIILAVVGINWALGEGGLIDRSKQARFYQKISTLEEDAKIRAYDTYFEKKTLEELIPNYGEVTQEQKNTILKEVPTLNETVFRITGETVYDRDLYWLNKEEILKDDKQYVIDMDTLQVYDYEGEKFLGKRWHTINGGIEIGDGEEGGDGEDIPEGYMRIHLQYPEDSTDRQWRIGRPGEIREDESLEWQDYTGEPILVKIDDIKNIWIRYNLKGVEIVEAPKGSLAVDIRVEPKEANQEKVTVSVYYEEGSTNQKIKVGNGGWRIYTGPFEVTENCVVEAMAEKEIDVTDNNGNKIGTTTIKGKDSVRIKNIGEKEINEELPAPTIEDLGKQANEKTTARVIYPEDQGNIRKVYKLNSGVETDYVGDIKIEEWGTELIAYYYTEEGEKSPEARQTFNDPTKLEVEIIVQPNPSVDATIKETNVEIEYSEEAEQKTYKIDNGEEIDYTGSFKVTKDCTITAYARKTGIDDAIAIEKIKFKQENEEERLQAPKFKQENNEDKITAKVTITYDEKAIIKKYNVNGEGLQDYTNPIDGLKDGDIVYAYSEDANGNVADNTYTVKIEEEKLQAPKFKQENNADKVTARVTITYDEKATIRKYSVNEGDLQDYTNTIDGLKNGDVIYAYSENAEGKTADGTYTVKIEENKMQAPRFKQTNNEDKTQATVTITFDRSATIKQYSVNSGSMQDYANPIEGLKDGDVVYAYSENAEGQSADGTYTVNLEKEPIDAPKFKQEDNAEKTQATVTITYDEKAVEKKYSVNGGDLLDYTNPIEGLEDGDIVYAINTDADGESADSTYTVKIKLEELKAPVISPNYIEDNTKARISIKYDDNATKKQYSINGGNLQDYTGPFEVTENGTVIYAVNENSRGDKKDATYTVDGIEKKLEVTIRVNPDTQEEVDKVMVEIDYDEAAETRTYRINGGEEQNYVGSFEVTENCTIIAEAKAKDAYGKDTKQITNLPKGLAAPVIKETKTEEREGEVANITIEYDKRSISNTYSINTEPMQNYTSGFQVRENDTVINAYSVDSAGNTASAQYVVDDLVRYLLIDKGKYYWILLPYPEQSINRQYKYKEDGVWKAYKEDGFILVKSEYEDELIQGGKPIKLEVEPGRYVDFDGHWYILDSDPQQLQEDIYMKWDDPENTTTPKLPLQILAMPAPPEKTDVVDIFIIYPETAVKKEYKIDDGSYTDYTGQLKITKNNTKITARTQYKDGSWSEEVSYVVTNIDENIAPEGIVEIDAEPKTPTKNSVKVTISYNPNSSALKKKYKIGQGSWQYTEENLVELTIDENTTIYAALENMAGQSSDAIVYNVENIDKIAPTVTMRTSNITSDSIGVIVDANDAESGLAESGTYKYYLDGALKETTTSNTYTYEGLTPVTTYTLKVEVTDKAGNMNEKSIEAKTTTAQAYVDGVLPVAPKISDGMTPVKWNGTNWIKTTVYDDEWYNYENKEWANVVLGDSTFSGDVLDEDKPYSMLVWIPRYAYKITSGWHKSGEEINPSNPEKGAGTIEVVFIDENDQDINGRKYAGVYNGTNGTYSDYVVHPAFNYGNSKENKLRGIWVGKYETSNTDCTTTETTGRYDGTDKTIQIKAGVTSWRSIIVSNIYTVSTQMNKSGNPYGLSTSDSNVDPHMMKNIEWGAVLYLSKSKYGKGTEEVWINPNSNYITGQAGSSVSASSTASTTDYKSTNGQKASTNRKYNRCIRYEWRGK